jgi:two-component system, chemotaxis family, response regulator Rcp1
MPFSRLRSQPVEVLLVEDNPGDVRLLEEAFKDGKFAGRLHVVRDGEQAMAFLRREAPFEESPRPSFILLDLNLPLKGGHEVLGEVKQSKELRQIPVFILSTSTGCDDINTAYDLHANCYIPKPVDLEKLVEMSQRLDAFWLNTSVFAAG